VDEHLPAANILFTSKNMKIILIKFFSSKNLIFNEYQFLFSMKRHNLCFQNIPIKIVCFPMMYLEIITLYPHQLIPLLNI
jgi:hypothetical protein